VALGRRRRGRRRAAPAHFGRCRAMPFTQPWRNFTAGDLVYGIKDDRKLYLQYGPFKAAAKGAKATTIDEYRVLEKELSKARVASKEDEEGFVQCLQDHATYKTAIGTSDDLNWAVRRKDKGGLYWATKVAKKHVHFVLDNLDIRATVLKNWAGKNPDKPAGPGKSTGVAYDKKNRSITGAELRWVYRNRNDPDVQADVQFWFMYAQVVPPWVQYSEFDQQNAQVVVHDGSGLWSQYAHAEGNAV
jgi:hypothetical protein